MARFPSSYIIKKEAKQGEFVLASNREPYVGPYLATKDGKYFAGSDKNLLGPPIVKQTTRFPKEFGKNKSTRIFNLLKKGIFKGGLRIIYKDEFMDISSDELLSIDMDIRGRTFKDKWKPNKTYRLIDFNWEPNKQHQLL